MIWKYCSVVQLLPLLLLHQLLFSNLNVKFFLINIFNLIYTEIIFRWIIGNIKNYPLIRFFFSIAFKGERFMLYLPVRNCHFPHHWCKDKSGFLGLHHIEEVPLSLISITTGRGGWIMIAVAPRIKWILSSSQGDSQCS